MSALGVTRETRLTLPVPAPAGVVPGCRSTSPRGRRTTLSDALRRADAAIHAVKAVDGGAARFDPTQQHPAYGRADTLLPECARRRTARLVSQPIPSSNLRLAW